MERLYRSSTQRILGGVCGGLGEYFNIDPTIVRVVYAIITIATVVVLGAALYLLLWLIIPAEGSLGKSTRESLRENVDDMALSARKIGDEVQATLRGASTGEPRRLEPAALAGLLLIGLGLLFLLGNLNLLGWFHWSRLWPLIIIVVGLLLLVKRR
jgi:phage shock protein PspC (stress-responsive transcriptional regulator)